MLIHHIVKATRSFIWVGKMCQKLYTCDHCYESWIQCVRGGQETGNLKVCSHYCIRKGIQRGDHSYWKIMCKCKSCPAANRIKLMDAVHMTSRRDRSHARLVLRNISPCRKSRSAAHHACPLGNAQQGTMRSCLVFYFIHFLSLWWLILPGRSADREPGTEWIST